MILDLLSGPPLISRALSRPLPSTLAVMPSVAHFHPSEFFPFGSVEQKKYYNRPKFLQAPDPDTLATPTFGIVGEAGRIQSWSLLDSPNLLDTFEGLTPPDHFYSWQDDFPASIPQKHTLSDSSLRFVNASIFPPPPTLEDIQRMEPDLSPESMMKRVGTIGAGDHPNDVRSNAALYPTARTKSSVSYSVVGGYSPIARPMKRCRTSSVGQGLFTQDFIDGIKREVRFTHKRLRVEADGFIWHARWYTDYLINALTRVQFRGKAASSAPVYDRLWRNITGFLWDFRFSESVVLLAFWYIDRLFPNGFMHPGMFTNSEGGAIAWRIFLLGNILAEKWLEDTTHLLSIWQPYFELPMKTVKALERTVLEMLDHNIYISNHEWQRWIKHLQTYCQTEFLAGHSNDLQCTAMEMLRELMADAGASPPEHDNPRALYTHEGNSCQLVLKLLEPCYSADRFEFTSVPLLLRTRSYLMAWNPAADPIVMKRPRTFGIAPIARPTNRAVRHPTHVSLFASRPMLANPIPNVFAEPDIDEYYYVPIMT